MKLEVKPTGLVEAIAALSGGREKVLQRWARTTFASGAAAVGIIQRKYRGARDTTPTATARRTGRLAASYGHEVRQDPHGVALMLGTIRGERAALEYAAVQEYGATIRPKRAKALTIPLPAAKTAAGVVRGGPRDFLNTFTVPGKPFIFQRQGDRVVALFKFMEEVTVPARPALLPALNDVLPAMQEQLVQDVHDQVEAGR